MLSSGVFFFTLKIESNEFFWMMSKSMKVFRSTFLDRRSFSIKTWMEEIERRRTKQVEENITWEWEGQNWGKYQYFCFRNGRPWAKPWERNNEQMENDKININK